jgi:hypothetical protein
MLGTEANDRCSEGKKKVMNAKHVIEALEVKTHSLVVAVIVVMSSHSHTH